MFINKKFFTVWPNTMEMKNQIFPGLLLRVLETNQDVIGESFSSNINIGESGIWDIAYAVDDFLLVTAESVRSSC